MVATLVLRSSTVVSPMTLSRTEYSYIETVVPQSRIVVLWLLIVLLRSTRVLVVLSTRSSTFLITRSKLLPSSTHIESQQH